MRLNSSPALVIAFGLIALSASPAAASAFSATAQATAAVACVGLNTQSVTNPTSASATASLGGAYGDVVGCGDPSNDGALEAAEGMAIANLATGLLQAYAAGDSDATPITGGGNGTAQFTDSLDIIPTGAGILVPGTSFLTLTLDNSYMDLFEAVAGAPDSIQGTIYATYNGINLTPVVGTCTVSYPSSPTTDQSCNLMLVMDIPLDASDTTFSFTMILNVNAQNGVADAYNTAQAGLILPAGDTFTSASGVFLTEQGEESTPEPGSLALLGASLLVFAGLRRRGI